MTLLDQFMQSAQKAAATVETVPPHADALTRCLVKLTEGYDCVLLGLAGDLDPRLFAPFSARPNVLREPTKEDLRTVRVGVTDALCGVASTGSVCVSLLHSMSAPVSMLTRTHIVVVDGRTIVPRVRDIFSPDILEGKGLRRSLTFITGPSATADMGPLVRGVHGPGTLHIVVLEEDHG
ncbi:MAG TPA: LUD domain-containing protein [Bacteroidota bacterium]